MAVAFEPISMPRVATKDLILRIKTESGLWHRLHPSTVKTACGIEVNYYRLQSEPIRGAEHPLAECQCWTDEERREADADYLTRYGRAYER